MMPVVCGIALLFLFSLSLYAASRREKPLPAVLLGVVLPVVLPLSAQVAGIAICPEGGLAHLPYLLMGLPATVVLSWIFALIGFTNPTKNPRYFYWTLGILAAIPGIVFWMIYPVRLLFSP